VEPHPRDAIPGRVNLTGWMIRFDRYALNQCSQCLVRMQKPCPLCQGRRGVSRSRARWTELA
jgi:hypothetical protein